MLLALANSGIKEIFMLLHETFGHVKPFFFTVRSKGMIYRTMDKLHADDKRPFGEVELSLELDDGSKSTYYVQVFFNERRDLNFSLNYSYVSPSSQDYSEERVTETKFFTSLSEFQTWAVQKVAEHKAYLLLRKDTI